MDWLSTYRARKSIFHYLALFFLCRHSVVHRHKACIGRIMATAFTSAEEIRGECILSHAAAGQHVGICTRWSTGSCQCPSIVSQTMSSILSGVSSSHSTSSGTDRSPTMMEHDGAQQRQCYGGPQQEVDPIVLGINNRCGVGGAHP